MKRSGIEIMNARTKNVSIAKETLEVCARAWYNAPSGNIVDISKSLDWAVNSTTLYQEPIHTKNYDAVVPTIEVVNETAAQATMRLITAGKTDIVALNFASARNQGGGFLSGAIAQEEDLCRCSGLYPCLKRKPVFYNENILCDNPYYTDNVIYSPRVPFFRDKHNQFLEETFELSIITAPAPCLRDVNKEGIADKVKGILLERAMKVLQIAEKHKHKNIILGAWGCGAFGNDPEMVANVFKTVLETVPCFEHVCFAVYDVREPPSVYETFCRAFGKDSKRMFPRS